MWEALFQFGRGVHDIHPLRFTSGATPLPVYNASIIASRLPHMRVSTEVGYWDLNCRPPAGWSLMHYRLCHGNRQLLNFLYKESHHSSSYSLTFIICQNKVNSGGSYVGVPLPQLGELAPPPRRNPGSTTGKHVHTKSDTLKMRPQSMLNIKS